VKSREVVMEWRVILIVILLIPVILFPASYVWYLNIGGVYAYVREARARRAAVGKAVEVPLK
jgi:hypothetical protein